MSGACDRYVSGLKRILACPCPNPTSFAAGATRDTPPPVPLSPFTMGIDAVPTFDLSPVLARQPGGGQDSEYLSLCAGIAQSLHETGCVIVRDPRVTSADNDRFLDLMERYFSQSREAKRSEERPDLFYQVGVTPEGVEVPRFLRDPRALSEVNRWPPEHRPVIPRGPDPKWRFFWRIGPRPAETLYAELNAEAVVPQGEGFGDWREVMDGWGGKLLGTLEVVAGCAAVGFGLEPNAFVDMMQNGPHLLGPTGTDLGVHCNEGACFAGYHYDLNFLTIHGKSRFPGLHVWLRNGHRVAVSVPQGCLLIQAGKQMEWLTGGYVRAGMHEVICSDATVKAVERAKAEGRNLWRVSSTVFGHIASDQVLKPLGRFLEEATRQQYCAVAAGEYVKNELEVIRLKKATA